MGPTIYLDNSLFKNDVTKFRQLSSLFKIFETKDLVYVCSCNLPNNSSIINEMKQEINSEIKIINAKDKEMKIKFDVDSQIIYKLLNIAIKHGFMVEADAFYDGQKVLQIVINDNYSSCITFSKEKYNIAEIKKAVKKAFLEAELA